MYFIDTEIYNVTSVPLFKASDESVIKFNGVSIHDIDAIANVGFLDLVASSSVTIEYSKIYNINFRKILDNASFISFISSSTLTFKDVEVFDAYIDGDFISIESADKNSDSLLISDSTFKNIIIKTGSIIKMITHQVI